MFQIKRRNLLYLFLIFSLLIKLSLQQGFLIPFFNFNLDDEEEEEEETKEKEFDDGLKPVFEKRVYTYNDNGTPVTVTQISYKSRNLGKNNKNKNLITPFEIMRNFDRRVNSIFEDFFKESIGIRNILSEMEKDEDGDTIFHNVDGHCPWWNSDGLCRLRILKGQEMTSLICRLHPLIIEEYESFTEGMLSISCPEAYRLILSSPVSSYPEITEKAEDEVLNLLAECRNTWLKEMDEEKSAEENLRLLYTFGEKYQKEINDAEDIEEPLVKYE